MIAESGVWWVRSWVIARTGVSPGVESIMTGQDGGDSALGCRIRVSGGGSDTRYRVVAAERAKQSAGGARESGRSCSSAVSPWMRCGWAKG